MIASAASVLVVLAGIYLLCLGMGAFLAPAVVRRFLLGFAESPTVHYLELALRLAVGGAFVLHAPDMLFAEVFAGFGWILLLTTTVLLVVPWRWHRQFARRSVPKALRHLPLMAVASLALGGFVLFAVFGGPV